MEALDITRQDEKAGPSRQSSSFRLAQDELERLHQLRPWLETAIGPALDALYAQIRSEPRLNRFFRDHDQMERAKTAQAAHWLAMCNGRPDDDHENRARRIGGTHARIGLHPADYIQGYATVIDALITALVAERFPRPRRIFGGGDPDALAREICALVKVTLLDMSASISFYIESLDVKREDAQTRLAFSLDKMAEALERLAGGDMTVSVDTAEFNGHDRLAAAFNLAVSNLSGLIAETRRSADTIRTSSREVAQASDDQARRTEQQAANLEQTSAAVGSLNDSVSETAGSARTTDETVARATKDAEAGGQVVTDMQTAMSQIESSAREMSQIIGVIDEIAFQTNLLALNAGVEAARAGESGKGFAVVASEVRTLAQRSADAAKSIKSLIEVSSGHVNSGVDLVQTTSQFITRTITAFGEVRDKVNAIATAAQDQARNLGEITSAIEQLDEMTQQNAAMVEETSAAGTSLANEADTMARQVSKFNLGV